MVQLVFFSPVEIPRRNSLEKGTTISLHIALTHLCEQCIDQTERAAREPQHLIGRRAVGGRSQVNHRHIPVKACSLSRQYNERNKIYTYTAVSVEQLSVVTRAAFFLNGSILS